MVLYQEGRYHHHIIYHHPVALMNFGWADGSFGMLDFGDGRCGTLKQHRAECILCRSVPQSMDFHTAYGHRAATAGRWQAAIGRSDRKENVVATFGMLFGFAEVRRWYEFWGNPALPDTNRSICYLVFNLLCAPCFAAMGVQERDEQCKWFWFAIGYQCGLAYVVSLCIYQIGTLITTGTFGIGTVVAFVLVIGLLYLLFRPYKESDTLKVNVKGMAGAR